MPTGLWGLKQHQLPDSPSATCVQHEPQESKATSIRRAEGEERADSETVRFPGGIRATGSVPLWG